VCLTRARSNRSTEASLVSRHIRHEGPDFHFASRIDIHENNAAGRSPRANGSAHRACFARVPGASNPVLIL
jgi:hypothetical protein